MGSAIDRYVERTIDGVRDAVEGERRNTLNGAAYAIGRVLHHGIDRASVESALMLAGVSAGLSRREALSAAQYGLRDGARSPREFDGAGRSSFRAQTVNDLHPMPRPDDLVPAPEVRAVLSDLWSAIGSAPLLEHGAEWAVSRGIRPYLADGSGCRTPTREQLGGVYLDHGQAAFIAAGLMRHDRRGDVVPAWRLYQHEPPRVWVPIWSPYWPDAPVAYRWRATHPSEIKALGMPVADHPWRDWPMGIGAEEMRTLVIVEGEPDWLTCRWACRDAWVIGIPGAGGWREHWRGCLRGRDRIVIAAHDDAAGQSAAHKIAGAIWRANPNPAQRPQVDLRFGDWNDALRDGRDVASEVLS